MLFATATYAQVLIAILAMLFIVQFFALKALEKSERLPLWTHKAKAVTAGTTPELYGKKPGIDPDYDLVLDPQLARNEYPGEKLDSQRAAEHTSLAARFATPEVWEKYKEKSSSGSKWTLARAINTGVLYPDSFVGCHAGDLQSYDEFKDFFFPLIEAYHEGFSVIGSSSSNLSTSRSTTAMERMNPALIKSDLSRSAKAKVVSTRIRVARNLAMFPLNPGGSKESRENVADLMGKVYSEISNDELKGKFFLHTTMSDCQRQMLVDGHYLFRGKDRMQAASGYHEFWPHGRGVFLSHDNKFVNWVNEGDHLRIISMQQGSDVKAVFARLSAGAAAIETGVRAALNLGEEENVFMMHPILGSVACCPSNLGTGMRGSVHIMVPKLIAAIGFEAIDKLVRERNCQARGSSGEHSEVVDRIDISNWRRIGVPEYELVDDMINCANFLAEEEDKLAEATEQSQPSPDLIEDFLSKDKVVICVTDVGLGGLSVVSEIERRLQTTPLFQSVSLQYFNSAVTPGYTQRPLRDQVSILNSALIAITAKLQPDIILIACNTLSVLYPETDFSKDISHSRTPILNIVDFGVDMLAEKLGKDNTSVAFVFGTTTTASIATHQTALAARGIAAERVVMKGCPKLATSIQAKGAAAADTSKVLSSCVHDAWVESKFFTHPTGLQIRKVFAGLCCTHYAYSLSLWEEALLAEKEMTTAAAAPSPNSVSDNTLSSPVETECLNPNSLMAGYLFQEAAKRSASLVSRLSVGLREAPIKIDVRVLSMVPLAEEITSIAPLLSAPVGNALREYEHRPDLFDNPLIHKSENDGI